MGVLNCLSSRRKLVVRRTRLLVISVLLIITMILTPYALMQYSVALQVFHILSALTKFLFFKTLLFAGVLVLEAKESFVICRALNSLKSKIVILLGYLGAGFY